MRITGPVPAPTVTALMKALASQACAPPTPAHLPRERIVYPAPSTCPCCGDNRLRKIGEDVTETKLKKIA
jgi:transposase